MIRRWLRRRAAQRALEAAHHRALARALAYSLEGSRRHSAAMREVNAGRAVVTSAMLVDLRAINAETDRLIAICRRIYRRINRR